MKVKYSLVFLMGAFIFLVPLVSIFIKNSNIPTQQTQTNQNEDDGEFKLLDVSSKNILTLSEKDYLHNAVLSEITDETHEEAIKTQVVITYTYASKMRSNEEKTPTQELNGAHFKVDVSKNIGYMTEEAARDKFKSKYKSISNKIQNAINEVYGVSVLYNGDFIISSYHAISAGKTESSEVIWNNVVPYLVPVDSEIDKSASDYKAETLIESKKIKELFKEKYPDIEFSEEDQNFINIESKSSSETVVSIKIGNKVFSGKEVREILSLKSVAFDVEQQEDKYKFTTYGIGNGVGLSQNGANEMAKEGKKYTEILSHYYPVTEIKNVKK